MELKLYEIEKTYLDLISTIIDADGEATDEQVEQLAITEAQLENKGRAYGFVIKKMETDIDVIDAEIKRLTAIKKTRVKTIDRIKETLSNAMQMFGITKLESPTLKISFRKSETVEVDNELINSEWCVEKITYSPDKAKIKEALKNGEIIVGAEIVEHQNLQIK